MAEDSQFPSKQSKLPSEDRILVLGNGSRTEELVQSSLEAHGLTVFRAIVPHARKDTPGYLREVKKAVNETAADTLIPVFFPEIPAEHADMFAGCRIMAGSPEIIMELDDKVSACALASRLGIPQPRTYEDMSQIDRWPVVFKRALGQGGDSVYFPRDTHALENLMKTAGSCLVTEYVEGYGLCVDCIRMGDHFDARAYRVLEPVGKGVSTKRMTVDAPEAVSYAHKMLDAVGYEGVCGVDFMVDEHSGKLLFLECNPRFSGGLETTIEAGLDLPWEWYRRLPGKVHPAH